MSGDTRPEKLSRYVSLVYQNPEDMFIKDSIEADIAYAMQVRNAGGLAGADRGAPWSGSG